MNIARASQSWTVEFMPSAAQRALQPKARTEIFANSSLGATSQAFRLRSPLSVGLVLLFHLLKLKTIGLPSARSNEISPKESTRELHVVAHDGFARIRAALSPLGTATKLFTTFSLTAAVPWRERKQGKALRRGGRRWWWVACHRTVR